MTFTIVGLGNPGEEYTETRHNTGRMALEYVRAKNNFSQWEFDKKTKAQISEGKLGKKKVTLVLPETFMNKSGNSLVHLKPRAKKAKLEELVVVHDELDLPLGKMKIVFNRGSGGHRGIESIIRALGTEAFTRIRVGIGLKKKLHGDEKINKFILGVFKPEELRVLKTVFKKGNEALAVLANEGKEKAMSVYNAQ